MYSNVNVARVTDETGDGSTLHLKNLVVSTQVPFGLARTFRSETHWNWHQEGDRCVFDHSAAWGWIHGQRPFLSGFVAKIMNPQFVTEQEKVVEYMQSGGLHADILALIPAEVRIQKGFDISRRGQVLNVSHLI